MGGFMWLPQYPISYQKICGLQQFRAVTVGKLLEESLLITVTNFGGWVVVDCLHFISILTQHRAGEGSIFQPKV